MKRFASVFAMIVAMMMLAACFAGCAAQGGDDQPGSDASTQPEQPGESTPAADDGEEIVIGGIGPLTGGAASYGISVKQGGQLAVDEINAAGGINGKQIKYLFEDDESDAEKALSAYSKLMDEGMQVLMGTVTSDPCIAVTDESSKDGILQITPSGSAEACAQYDNCFRICFTDPLQGRSMANYMYEEGVRKVAVIYDVSSDYSSGIYEAFVDEFEALGGTVVAAESFTSGDVDFKTQLTKIKATDAEALFLPIYYTEVAYISNQAVNVGLKLPYYGCDGWDGVIAQLEGDTTNIEGAVYLTPFVANSEDEAVQKFVADYKAKFGADPDQFAADAYDAIYTIKAAIEKAGSMDNDAIIAAMTEITVPGITGEMTFTKEGEPNKAARVAVIKDGQYIGK